MAGLTISIVLIPRFTTIAGKVTDDPGFTTVAMDVSPYSNLILTMWRGAVIGTAPPTPPPVYLPVSFFVEESTDRVVWQPNTVGPTGVDPGENAQLVLTFPLTKRYLRVRVVLYADDNITTCWAIGSVEERRS